MLFDSPVRVLWDPGDTRVVLVAAGAPMWDLVRVDGSQQVQVAGAIRRQGVRNLPRRNEEHVIEFTICRMRASVAEAMSSLVEDAIALPRGMKDVLLTYTNGKQFLAKNCAIQSWPGSYSPENDSLNAERVRILCGEILTHPGTYTGLTVWGES